MHLICHFHVCLSFAQKVYLVSPSSEHFEINTAVSRVSAQCTCAAAAESRWSCPTLCDPRDGSLAGSVSDSGI